MLQSMGLQRVKHNWTVWTESLWIWVINWLTAFLIVTTFLLFCVIETLILLYNYDYFKLLFWWHITNTVICLKIVLFRDVPYNSLKIHVLIFVLATLSFSLERETNREEEGPNHCSQVIFSEASLLAQSVKNLPALQETWVQSLGQEDPLEKEVVKHSSILAWEIPWTEEPGGLQSMGSERVRHDWTTNTLTYL